MAEIYNSNNPYLIDNPYIQKGDVFETVVEKPNNNPNQNNSENSNNALLACAIGAIPGALALNPALAVGGCLATTLFACTPPNEPNPWDKINEANTPADEDLSADETDGDNETIEVEKENEEEVSKSFFEDFPEEEDSLWPTDGITNWLSKDECSLKEVIRPINSDYFIAGTPTLPAHAHISKNGRYIIFLDATYQAENRQGAYVVYDFLTEKQYLIGEATDNAIGELSDFLNYHYHYLQLLLSPNGRYVVIAIRENSADDNYDLYIQDLAKDKITKVDINLENKTNAYIYSLGSFSGNGQFLGLGIHYNTSDYGPTKYNIAMLRMHDKALHFTNFIHANPIRIDQLSYDGKQAIGRIGKRGDSNKPIQWFNLECEIRKELPLEDYQYFHMNNNGNRILYSRPDSSLYFVDVETGEERLVSENLYSENNFRFKSSNASQSIFLGRKIYYDDDVGTPRGVLYYRNKQYLHALDISNPSHNYSPSVISSDGMATFAENFYEGSERLQMFSSACYIYEKYVTED